MVYNYHPTTGFYVFENGPHINVLDQNEIKHKSVIE